MIKEPKLPVPVGTGDKGALSTERPLSISPPAPVTYDLSAVGQFFK